MSFNIAKFQLGFFITATVMVILLIAFSYFSFQFRATNNDNWDLINNNEEGINNVLIEDNFARQDELLDSERFCVVGSFGTLVFGSVASVLFAIEHKKKRNNN